MRVGQYLAVVFLISIDVKGGSVNGPVRLNKGDPVAHLRNISKIKPGGRWTLEKNATVVLRRCSPEEESRGCRNKTSPPFSVLTLTDKDVIVLHNVTESDAGSYVFQVAGDKEELFNVSVENPTIGSTETESPNTSSTSKALAICLSILAVVLLLLLLYFMYKYKEKITIWFEGVKETYCGMSAKSSECDKTSTDSEITNNNENPQNLQLLLPRDVKPPVLTTSQCAESITTFKTQLKTDHHTPLFLSSIAV